MPSLTSRHLQRSRCCLGSSQLRVRRQRNKVTGGVLFLQSKKNNTHKSRRDLRTLSSLLLFTRVANAGKVELGGGEEGEEEVEEDEEEEETGRDEYIEARLSLQLSQSLPL